MNGLGIPRIRSLALPKSPRQRAVDCVLKSSGVGLRPVWGDATDSGCLVWGDVSFRNIAQFEETGVVPGCLRSTPAKHGGGAGTLAQRRLIWGDCPAWGDRPPGLKRRAALFGETAPPGLKRQTARFGETGTGAEWADFTGCSEASGNRQFARQDLHVVIDKINNNKILMLSFFING
jgi:hypothetical protein